MKITINIFAFIFILLTILPTIGGALGSCEIETNCCEETSTPSDQSSEDNCLSFCFCTCCGTTVYFDKDKEVNPQPQIFSTLNSTFIYQSLPSFQISLDIWQPPKSA